MRDHFFSIRVRGAHGVNIGILFLGHAVRRCITIRNKKMNHSVGVFVYVVIEMSTINRLSHHPILMRICLLASLHEFTMR